MNRNAKAVQELQRLFRLTTAELDSVIACALDGAGESAYCDIYFQSGCNETLVLDQGQLRGTMRESLNGAGVRVVIGETVGYSFSDVVNLQSLLKAAVTARGIAKFSSGSFSVPISTDAPASNLYPTASSPTDIDLLSERMALLAKINQEARSCDPRIENVTVVVSSEDHSIIIANSLGQLEFDQRPLVEFQVHCLASDGTRREIGTAGGGGRMGFDEMSVETFWKPQVQYAAKQAVDLLGAVPAPAGVMKVVLGAGTPGVFIHEAVVHGLEGDFIRQKSSAFSGRLGELVASPLVSIVDDGSMFKARGALNFDDEGTPTQRTVLIENGVLKNYLYDRQNAALMGVASTGNGRRMSYQHAPMPRMTSTFMAGGDSSREEIIKAVDFGFYAESFSGGRVNMTNGDFTFAASAAWLIEKGKLTRMAKGATIIGNGPQALNSVLMVGNDPALDPGVGICGKNGQQVPVNVGTPSILLDAMTVGGSAQ